jgi:hypothetical protein
VLSSSFVTVSVTYTTLYYWAYNATSALLDSGSFTFPTSDANAAGFVESSDNTCGLLRTELDSSYAKNSAYVYVNSVKTSQEVSIKDDMRGSVSPTYPNNYLVDKWSGTSNKESIYVSFCDSSGTTCANTPTGSVTVPKGGTIFLLLFLKCY